MTGSTTGPAGAPLPLTAADDGEWVVVDHASAVGRARRVAESAAARLGLDEERVAEVGLVASELATNQVRHAGAGTVHVRALRSGCDAAVHVLAVDSGPGMRDITAAMRDGSSTGGTLGIGLGTLPRLTTAWDAWTAPGHGTVVSAALAARRSPTPAAAWLAAPTAVSRALTGQSVCGDGFAVRRDDDATTVLVADGLGHGPLAATASREAVRAFLDAPAAGPLDLLRTVHRALSGTRGAAVAVAQHRGDALRWAGLGNIVGAVHGGRRVRGLVSHPGIAGSHARSLQETTLPLEAGDVVVLHSDGVTDRMPLDDHPGLLARTPAVVAAVLLRDFGVRRDDACVLVLPASSRAGAVAA